MSRAKLRRFFRHGLLPQLFVFEAVARLGSITRASEELYLAQPTVSLQLKKLAETLEVTLFEQRGRQLYLTSAGQALREACEELLQCLGRIDAKLEPWRKPVRERLRLAAEPEARRVASRLLAEYSGRHPGVEVTLFVADRLVLLQRFAASADDVYLFELQVDELPLERRWTVVHPKGSPPGRAAAAFLREALLDAGEPSANNPPKEVEAWNSRANTTRRSS